MKSVSFTIVAMLTVMLFATGCTTSMAKVDGKPLPELTFEHIAPFQVEVAEIEIENNYEIGSDSRDVSSGFPTPPDIALRRYAERRLQPSGSGGILKFIVEDSHVYHKYIAPEGALRKWMRMGGKDRYDVSMRFRMYEILPDGTQGVHSVLTVERYLAVPENLSIARREQEQLKFLELLMQDVDDAVTQSLQGRLNLAGEQSGKQEVSVNTLLGYEP